MSRQIILFFVVGLFIISILAQRDKKKTCIHNLVLDGTNLIAAHRKQLLVIGIANFSNPASRAQANRYNDLYRELQRHDIRESIARVILINEKDAKSSFHEKHYDKIRFFQDNSRDRIIKKLRNNQPTTNNLVFGRCGYLLYSQEGTQTDLENGKNYQDLLRVITIAVKNKRRCQGICS